MEAVEALRLPLPEEVAVVPDVRHRAVDPQAREAIYRRIDRRLLELQPCTYLFSPMEQAALTRRVSDIRPGPRGILAQYPGVARMRVHEREGP